MYNSTLDCALSYAAKGWYVIPLRSIVNGQCTCKRRCRSPGKHPIFSKWQNKASIDPGQINSWWQKYPDANIGIVTGKQSGLVVIDIDPRNGGDASLNDLCDSYTGFKPILDTFTVKTGGNGQHFYYAYDKPFKSVKKHGLGPGIDIKADGGYILAPPSNHISGGFYSVTNDVLPLELPPMLIDLIHQPKANNIQQKTIPEGERNNFLASIAGKLFAEGHSLNQVKTYLKEENTLRCYPPLSFDEVNQVAESIHRTAQKGNCGKSLKTQWQEAVVDAGEGPGFIAVLTCLSFYMDVNGRNCFPTQEELSDRLGMTRKTVIKHLNKASEIGLIKRYQNKRTGAEWNYGYIAVVEEP